MKALALVSVLFLAACSSEDKAPRVVEVFEPAPMPVKIEIVETKAGPLVLDTTPEPVVVVVESVPEPIEVEVVESVPEPVEVKVGVELEPVEVEVGVQLEPTPVVEETVEIVVDNTYQM
tara:strand:- start:378 stop:734 length:357 start_codon:yes stop_codon:yes gene_type:complete